MSLTEGATPSAYVSGTKLVNDEVTNDMEDLLNFKNVNLKSAQPATCIGKFLFKQ